MIVIKETKKHVAERIADAERYRRDRKQRQEKARAYYYKNKKKMRAYQDKYWRSQEGWAVIVKGGCRRDMKKQGFSEAEIQRVISKMPKRITHRKGIPLMPWKYQHYSKYNQRLK